MIDILLIAEAFHLPATMSHGFLTLATQDAGGNVFTYFNQSNLAGKIIVLVLIVTSLIAWSVMIGKYLDLSRLRTLNSNFERRLNDVDSVLRMGAGRRTIGIGPFAVLVAEAIDSYYAFLRRGGSDHFELKMALSHVENAIQREVAGRTVRYETRMVLLGSIVAGAPFLGLLGTVWGVMDAFGSLSLQGSATLQNLAPGVSGALLTTVAALLVAIPSVFGYNFLLSKVKTMILELENFASTLADRIELELQEAADRD